MIVHVHIISWILGWLGGHGSVTRGTGSGRYVRCWLVTRLVICFVDPCLGIVAPHSLFNDRIDVTLPQEQCISLWKLHFVWIGLNVLADLIEAGFPPESKNGFVTHLYFCVVLYTCCAAKSPARTLPATPLSVDRLAVVSSDSCRSSSDLALMRFSCACRYSLAKLYSFPRCDAASFLC